MKNQLKIIMLVVPLFFGSIVMQEIPGEWLGDWTCKGQTVRQEKRFFDLSKEAYYETIKEGCTYGGTFVGEHSARTHYGFRRWLLWILAGSLTVYNLVKFLESE